MQKPTIVYNLSLDNPVMEDELKWRVVDNIEGKLTSSLKKIYAKGEDVICIVKVTITQVAEWYDGDFKIEYDGIGLDYVREWFEILEDLVNHAFDNFKQRILAK
jgi:hypothetical protein